MGLMDPSKRVVSTAEMVGCRPHTRFLKEPVDLVLVDPVILGSVEQSQPIQHTDGVRAGIQEVKGEEMGLRPETRPPSVTLRWKMDGMDLRVCALYFENIISHTVNIRRPGLNKAVGQSLHVPNLVPFGISVFLVVVSEY